MSQYVKFWERFHITDMFSEGVHFGKIKLDKDKCTGCGLCVKICPGDTMELDADRKPSPNQEIADICGDQVCASCGACQAICPQEAIVVVDNMMLTGKFKSLRRGPVSKPRMFSELAPKAARK